MSLCLGKPLFLGTTCGIPLAGFNHNQVPDCMPTHTQIPPFGGDARRNAHARPSVLSDVSEARATRAKTPSDDLKRYLALSRHNLTATRGHQHPIPITSKQALRTLRNRSLDYERVYQRQIGDGRPDEYWIACGAPNCYRCTFYDRLIMYNLKPYADWREEIFISLMLKVLRKAGVKSARGKAVSWDDVNSFVQSPPIRGAFWDFHKMCGVSVEEVSPEAMTAKLAGMMPAVVRIVQAPVIGEVKVDRVTKAVKKDRYAPGWYLGDLAYLRSGGRQWGAREKKTTPTEEAETWDVHKCFSHPYAGRPKTWVLEDYLLQFCVVAESWRRYGLQRGCRWGFGGAVRAADLICAVLLNWWCMTQFDVFKRQRHSRLSMNLVWEQWMARYPRFLQDNDEMEEQGRRSSEKVLQGVGRAVMLGFSDTPQNYVRRPAHVVVVSPRDPTCISWKKLARARLSKKPARNRSFIM